MAYSEDDLTFFYQLSGGLPGAINVLSNFMKGGGTLAHMRRLSALGLKELDFCYLHTILLKENVDLTNISLMALAVRAEPEKFMMDESRTLLNAIFSGRKPTPEEEAVATDSVSESSVQGDRNAPTHIPPPGGI